MRDQAIWSVSLGRWNGVQIRLHMFFLLFAALTLYLGWLAAQSQHPRAASCSIAFLVILLLSVVVHELGHVIVANRLGGSIDEVVLGPLGGLGALPAPLEPPSELVVVVAGPLANLGVCLLTALCLLTRDDTQLLGMMNPLPQVDLTEGTALIVGLKLVFWINWVLALVNLIPAYPFDGARALKAAIMTVRARVDPQRAVLLVAAVAKVIALGMLVVAWLVSGYQYEIVPPWFALVLLSIFVFFSARKAESMATNPTGEDAFLGYDFSEGYTSLERSGPKTSTKPRTGPLLRWWQRRRELREQKQREIEAFEDGRVDEILVQVHQAGFDSLTAEDRALLRRASARYRNRAE